MEEDRGRLLVVEDDPRIAVLTEERVLLRRIEAAALLGRFAVDRDDALPWYDGRFPRRPILENKDGKVIAAKADRLKAERRPRFAGDFVAQW